MSKRGRKPAANPLTDCIYVRMTQAEKRAMQAFAKRLGLTLSALMRRQILLASEMQQERPN